MWERAGRCWIVLMMVALSAWGQTSAATRPVFEVAVIKQVDYMQAIGALIGRGRFEGLEISAQRVRVDLQLRSLIALAYGVQISQIEGPEWLIHPLDPWKVPMLNIEAKLPEGATPAQIPEMLRNLLEDRFQLKVRPGSKQMDAYELSAGKSGPKFQRTAVLADNAGGFVQLEKQLNFERSQVTERTDGGRVFEMSSIKGLIDFLHSQLGRVPLIDRTGLEGPYDIRLELPRSALDDFDGKETDAQHQEADAQDRRSVAAALQKIGLKLEKGKNVVDTIVIEQLEKTPSEN